MSQNWKKTPFTSVDHVLDVLAELRGKRWLCRGQSKHDDLMPTIDRDARKCLSRREKLMLERQAINVFRSTAQFFAGPGEKGALVDDIVALMVLRHYGVPTRLLDWSASPYVAAYFAACSHDEDDGEIWSFDEPQYERIGLMQWKQWPETTTDHSGDPSKFVAGLTAFTTEEPPNWLICAFYTGFPRQDAQAGAYTMTARFGRNHSEAIAELLSDDSRYHLYKVDAALKPKLREILREKYGVWRGLLFPDSAGAADTAKKIVFKSGSV